MTHPDAVQFDPEASQFADPDAVHFDPVPAPGTVAAPPPHPSTSHPFGGVDKVPLRASRNYSNPPPVEASTSARLGMKGLLERTRSLYWAGANATFGDYSDSDSSNADNPQHIAITSVLLRMEFLSDWEYTIYLFLIFLCVAIVFVFMALTVSLELYIQTPGGSYGTDLSTLISFWVIFFCCFTALGVIGMFIERITRVRTHEWISNQWRLVWTTLVIAIAAFLFLCSYMVLYSFALFADELCPYQNKLASVITSLQWGFVIVFYTSINAQVIDHTIDLDGNLNRRSLKFSWNVKEVITQSGFLHLPNLALAVIGSVQFVIDIANPLSKSDAYFHQICEEYVDAPVVDRPNTEFCLEFSDNQAYGAVGESIVTIIFFALFIVYTLIAYSRLLQVPWTRYRHVNISFRILITQTIPVLLALAASNGVHALRKIPVIEDCPEVQDGLQATPEICILVTVWVFVRCYCSSPLMAGEYRDSIRSTTVQNFLWLEPGDRVVSTTPFWEHHIGDATHNKDRINYGKKKTLASQPVFVFETMLKMLYFCELIYLEDADDIGGLGDVRDAKYSREETGNSVGSGGSEGRSVSSVSRITRRRATAFAEMRAEFERESQTYNRNPETGKKLPFATALAMGMEQYDLEYYRVFHEALSESKVVVAWNSRGIIVVSFRGTAAIANALTDISCCRTTWRSMEAKAYKNIKGLRNILRRFWERPTIHHGFKKAMRSENVGLELIDFVSSLATNFIEEGKYRPCIRVTGHSLGGALAILLSFELFQHCEADGLKSEEVSVYTFGCPGVCNRSARDVYQTVIPTTFNVVNGVDFIAYTGTWLQFQKPGLPVLINSFGDLIYRPSKVESSMHHFFFRESLTDHFLSNYRSSVEKIIELNCSPSEADILIRANPLLNSKHSNLGIRDEVRGRWTTAIRQAETGAKTVAQAAINTTTEGAKKVGLTAFTGFIGFTRLGLLKSLSADDEDEDSEGEGGGGGGGEEDEKVEDEDLEITIQEIV
ncbi:hypothetical protein TL16_g11425 [Triparma laevis f. inornata]|uniref:Fungal lipase-type domain-containing protein n=1 Tax=Triparma laevis f. inornata TaxID=1714386 RepID=A0A9W7ETI9_9STRA|nr:hypothetical protein TL16_g11425 [Triparma laevis f. inornata]